MTELFCFFQLWYRLYTNPLNPHMNYLLSLLLVATILAPATAKADIAPDPGFHEFTQCAFIDNLTDYADYDVYSTLNWRFGPSLTPAQESQTPPTDCQDNGEPFFAIKKSNQANIVHQDDPGQERGDIWDELAVNQPYLIKATTTGVVTAISDVTAMGDLPDTNPAVWFVAVYHIDSLTDTAFNVRLVGESRYDAKGLLVSSPTVSDDSTTSESAATSWFTSERLPWVILIGAGVLLLAIAMKSRKNSL